MKKQHINGTLIIYHHFLAPNAAMIMDHVRSFPRYSQFKTWTLNTEFGFPESLRRFEFQTVVLHWSLFGWIPFQLNQQWMNYLAECEGSQRLAFFQDEYHFWPERTALLRAYRPHCVYTCLEPQHYDQTYRRFVSLPRLITTIPGFVPEDVVKRAPLLTLPDAARPIDVGYRGRQSPFYMGRGAYEKQEIGIRFAQRAKGSGLVLDLEWAEHKRIYGKSWNRFLARCRGTLGVEAGVSIFDTDNLIAPQVQELLAQNPELTFEEVSARLLCRYEDNGIYYRTISPRVFEAAAVRTCQILYEGKYSNILKPMVHYIPLKKDFANFDEVMRLFLDRGVRREITENAYRDLIASGRLSYRSFIRSFDADLMAQGLSPGIREREIQAFDLAMRSEKIATFPLWLKWRMREVQERIRSYREEYR